MVALRSRRELGGKGPVGRVPRPVPLGAAALNHELPQDAVEAQPVIEALVHQAEEVPHGDRSVVPPELELHGPHGGSSNRHLHPDVVVPQCRIRDRPPRRESRQARCGHHGPRSATAGGLRRGLPPLKRLRSVGAPTT